MKDPRELAQLVREQLPPGGLFARHRWRWSPAPFRISAPLLKQFEQLGRVLLQFYRAVNLLHRKSETGQQPGWIADWLNRGKPEWLLELQRHPGFKNALPRVIRPDILLTEDGFSITELDSVPGGIGLTDWLNAAYTKAGYEVVGGKSGMLEGFTSILGDSGRRLVVVSEESATYRPEMEWLASQAPNLQVMDGDYDDFQDNDSVYRFFELFDLENVSGARKLFERASQKQLTVTPPPKPIFEEKMLFALFWNRNLREFWRQELGASFFDKLQKHLPYTWVIDSSPLPPQAAYPRLDITDWNQLKGFSQKERDLILKVSGYSEEAWGSRGVYYGSDLSAEEWSVAVDKAISGFAKNPYILQPYKKPAIVQGEWFNFEKDALEQMNGRVRLCPYYFITGEAEQARANLGGILATLCPADKKIIHGMEDAILVPCMI